MESYMSPKIELRESPLAGKGLFAKAHINKGELVIDFTEGPGTYMSTEDADKLYEEGNDYILQVGDDSFFVATSEEELEDVDFINHSCDPSLGVNGSLKFVAIRDIEPGEEITFDYAMTESSDYSMECNCGSTKCREVVTGDDWKMEELQDRYDGYFSDYLQKKIDALRGR